MLTLLKLHAKGFCSISDLELPLNNKGIILIKASNGKGKTSIFSALVWGLYGKSLKGVSDVVTWKDIQPKDYKGVLVEVYFSVDNHTYKVVRCQKYKDTIDDGAKGNDRVLLMKDADILDIKGKLAIQDKINQVIGLSYNLFMNSIMFGQGIKRLIQEPNSDKKKLFEEVFDLNYLNIAKGIALEDKNNLISKINEVERESAVLKESLEQNIATYKELKEREASFSEQIRQERKELKETRSKFTKRLIEVKKHLSDDFEIQFELKLKRKKDSLIKLKEAYNKAKSIGNIPIESFIDEVYMMLKNKQYVKAKKSLKTLKDSFIRSRDIHEQITKTSDSLSRLEEINRNYQDYVKQANDLSDDIASIDSDLLKLKEEKLKVLSPKYKENIAQIRSRLRKVDEDYHNKELELKNYQWVIDDPLGNNGIKAYLFDSSLDILNKILESYSNILGFRIAFEIDLSSTRKEFCTLIERGKYIIEYDELSGGEKQLVNLAMAFAMNEALTASRGINIAFLDEVFESLSQDNIEIVISLIRYIFENKALFLITHHTSLPLPNTKILQVDKVDGLSYYRVL